MIAVKGPLFSRRRAVDLAEDTSSCGIPTAGAMIAARGAAPARDVRGDRARPTARGVWTRIGTRIATRIGRYMKPQSTGIILMMMITMMMMMMMMMMVMMVMMVMMALVLVLIKEVMSCSFSIIILFM